MQSILKQFLCQYIQLKWKPQPFSLSVTVFTTQTTGRFDNMDELMAQGLQLMALGMGTVFVFLTLLIGVISLVSHIIQKYDMEAENAVGAAQSGHDDLLEVISAAVQQYRADHPRRKS